MIAGEDDRLGARPDAELVEEVRRVIADGLFADAQTLGDVRIAQALGHQRKDLALAGRQPVEYRACGNRIAVVAKVEKYELPFGCVSGPDYGAMGMHFVNFPLVLDGVLDATRPEIVIYEPLPNGRLRLIGADYLVLADAWNATHSSPPELGGQLFHFFEAPNRFGLPPFYTLHVWAWKENPTGAFVNWHANVSCEAFSGQNP